MSRDVEVLRDLREAEAWEPHVVTALDRAISALETRESDSLALASCRARLEVVEKALRDAKVFVQQMWPYGLSDAHITERMDVMCAIDLALDTSPPSTTRPPDAGTEHHDQDDGRDDAIAIASGWDPTGEGGR